MTIRGTAFVVTEILLLIFGLGTARREIFICFFCVAVIGAFSVLSALVTALTLRIDAHLSADRVIRGEKVDFQMEVNGLALFPTNICINVSVPGTAKDSIPCAFQVMPGRKTKVFKCELMCRHRGEWNITIQKLRLYDLFGFFSFPVVHTTLKRNRFALSLSVAPQTVLLNRKPRRHFADSGEDTSRCKASESGETFGDTRLYREGDHMRRIHWIQTARSGEVYVRRYEEQANQAVLVLLDCTYKTDGVDTADIATETALSIVNSYENHSIPVRLMCVRQKTAGKFDTDIIVSDKSALQYATSLLTAVSFSKPKGELHISTLGLGKKIRVGSLHVVTAVPSQNLITEMDALRPMGVSTSLWIPAPDTSKRKAPSDTITEHRTLHSSDEILSKVGDSL